MQYLKTLDLLLEEKLQRSPGLWTKTVGQFDRLCSYSYSPDTLLFKLNVLWQGR